MTKKSKRLQEAESLGLLPVTDLSNPGGILGAGSISAYPDILSGYGEFTPITVRSSSIPLDANLE